MEEKLVHQLDMQIMDTDLPPVKNVKRRKSGIFPKIFLGLIIPFILFTLFAFFKIYRPAKKLVSDINAAKTKASEIMPAVKNQDLPAIQSGLKDIKNDLEIIKSDYLKFSWSGNLPLLKNYYADGNRAITASENLLSACETSLEAIAPYADILGFKGLSATGDGGKTAQDRINFIINTLDKIKPQLSQIGEYLTQAKQAVDGIDPNRYPRNFRGIPVREKFTQGISVLDQASLLVNDARPMLENTPYMLGVDSPRKYLVLFQNDAELRATGGFITAYAIIQVDKGKISTIQSDDIYALDNKFTKKIPAPDPIKKYLPKVPYWYLRDQNLSPDFKVSMETFFPNYQTINSPKVDGIIAVDTQLLVELIKITGPIGVPGFGTYSANNDPRCNCPNVWYELELYADVEGPVIWDSGTGQIISKPQNYGARKAFIGPMMYSVLANVMAQPKSKMSQLFTTIMDQISAKHILLYFPDAKTQQAVESFNLAGRVKNYSGDYLFIADTNFAGAKTNAWVTYSADQKIDISGDGTVTKTLTIKYNNPQAYFEDPKTKLRLNGMFRDWLRVYVPRGSKLLKVDGFETGQVVTEDLGKTVFEGFFTLTPLNVRTITLSYQLPDKIKSPYKILIQKQGGSKNFSYNNTVNGKTYPEIILSSDKELVYPF